MNKKGQLFMLGLMIAFMGFIVLTQLITPFKDNVRDVRSADKMNCTDPNLSDGEQATCILVDWSLFYYIGTGMAVVIGFLTWKKLSQ